MFSNESSHVAYREDTVLTYRRVGFYLVPSEVLGKDPVVDVIGDTGEGSVDDLCAGSLYDALRDGPGVGSIGKSEELSIDTTSYLHNKAVFTILMQCNDTCLYMWFTKLAFRGCGTVLPDLCSR